MDEFSQPAEIVDRIDSCVVVYQPVDDGNNFKITYVNQAAERMDKIRKNDVVNRYVTEVFPGIREFGLFDVFRRVWKTGKADTHSVTLYRDPKMAGWREYYVYKLSSEFIVAVYKEAIERKLSEEVLKIEQDNYRHSMDNSPLGIQIFNQMKLIYVNQTMLDMWGYETIEQLQSVNIHKAFIPDSVKKLRQMFIDIKNEVPIETIELTMICANGKLREIRAYTKELMWNGESCGQTIYEDISEIKVAERRLIESEERYRAFFEHNMDAVLITGPDGSIYAANSEACKMFKMSEQQIINGGRRQLVDESDSELKARLSERKRTGQFRGEIRLRRGDGSMFPAEVSSGIFNTSQGDARTVMTIRDISGRKQREKELKKSHDKLAALSAHINTVLEQERSRLSREIHDEFGQSLTALQLDLYLLKKQLPEGDAKAAERWQHMLSIIDSTIGSVQKLSWSLRPSLLDDLGLLPALEWLTDDFEKRTGVKCLRILPETEPDFDPETASQIFRIVQEALTNVTRHSGASELHIRLRTGKTFNTLQIRDNGKGIQDKELNDIKSFGIMGMKERARQIGGNLTIKGELKKGTTITIRLPLKNTKYDASIPRM
jgi:PAS domain S-box-containing protein